MGGEAPGSIAQAQAIEVQGLTKSFGSHLALNGIDLTVEQGQFLAVLGPNGAGKTTLIKVLAGLSKPSGGTVRVAGLNLRERPVEMRRKIGVVTHQTFLYDNLTAFENLKFYGRMYDVPNVEERIRELVAKIGLTSRLHDRVGTLSRGMQQRFSIARAMVHSPPIILLDEPETGLDQHARAVLYEMLDDSISNGSQGTVVMTTHSLERGVEKGDHIVILAKGKVVYERSNRSLGIADLRDAYHHFTGARN